MSAESLLSDVRTRIARARDAKDRSVLVLVGSGVSIAATANEPAASWTGLLDLGIARCQEVVQERKLKPLGAEAERERMAQNLASVPDLLAVATEVEKRLRGAGGTVYRDWLRETVGALTPSQPAILEALAGLGLGLLTTNYDSLLEQTLKVQGMSWQSADLVQAFLSGTTQSVLHVHGHFADPASVVLGEQAYVKIRKDKKFQTTLRNLLQSHDVIFVGLGGGFADPNFSALMDWAIDEKLPSTRQHVWLLRDAEADAQRPQVPLDARLHVVGYGAAHEDLVPFLRGLGGASKRDEEARKAVMGAFQEAADFDAFFLDCFRETRKRFRRDMDLQACLTLLLSEHGGDEVLFQLRHYLGHEAPVGNAHEDAARKQAAKRLLWEALFRLDRNAQWQALVASLDDAHLNRLALLSGHEDQSPTLFIQRMEQRLEHEGKARVVLLPQTLDNTRLATDAGWGARLAGQIATALKRPSGGLPAMLADATAEQPLVLILVEKANPLKLLSALTQDQPPGLWNFLQTRLPSALQAIRRVTILLPLVHRASETPALAAARTLAQTDWNRRPLVHQELNELAWPPWQDVEYYLRSHPEEINLADALDKAKKLWPELSKPGMTFARLTERLDDIVEQTLLVGKTEGRDA